MNDIKEILQSYNLESNCFLGTLDFLKKKKINIMTNNIIEIDNIINGEDIFSCEIP